MTARFGACAPSNIALIKYMGKKEGTGNLPENGSLSMTLSRLCTFAELSIDDQNPAMTWLPEMPRLEMIETHLKGSQLKPSVPTLKEDGITKVLRHLERVRSESREFFPQFGLEAKKNAFGAQLRTANTFPAASGIASSASAFAAITWAMSCATAVDPSQFEKAYADNVEFRRRLARLSRVGSGSSCRSFEGPWVYWKDEETRAVSSPLRDLAHFVLIVSDQQKRVSSSQAHAMIKTSPLWNGRVDRVEQRLQQLENALRASDLRLVAQIAWREAWEMHSLFHTASEPFSYWEPESMAALQFLSPAVQEPHPPIVTLDAGPNVHIIVESRFADEWRSRLKERFPTHTLLEDRPGTGAFGYPLTL